MHIALFILFYPVFCILIMLIICTVFRASQKALIFCTITMISLPVLEVSISYLEAKLFLLSIPEREVGTHLLAQKIQSNQFYIEHPNSRNGSPWGCRSVCQKALLDHGFKTVETNSFGPSRFGLTTTAGIYRFRLQEAGHSKCELFAHKEEPRLRDAVESGLCISSEKIVQPESEYGIFYYKKKYRSHFLISVTKFTREIGSLSGSHTLGKTIWYGIHYTGPFNDNIFHFGRRWPNPTPAFTPVELLIQPIEG